MKNLVLLAIFCSLEVFGQSTIDKAKALYEAKKYDEASRLLKSINNSNQTYAEAQFYLGRMAFEQEHYDDAEEYLEAAIEANPKVADYHYWLGSTLGTIAGDANVFKQGMLAPRIKSEFEETVKLDPKNLDAWRGLITFYTEAPGFMGGSYDKAHEVANEIAKIDVAEGHRARASIYSREEKFDEAEKEYLAAYKLKPQLIGQVSAYYISRKQYDKSFKLAEDASQKDPSNMSLIYIIGRTSAISGQRLERGEECMKKYLAYQPKENEPSHGGALMRLGQIYEKRGIKSDAKKSYEAAIKMDPTLKEAKEGLERVSR